MVYKYRGFSLIELVIVLGILTILLSATLLALNPQAQFARVQETKITSDLQAVRKGLYQCLIDNSKSGNFSNCYTGTVGADVLVANGLTQGLNLCPLVTNGYITELPVNTVFSQASPTTGRVNCTTTTNYISGFFIRNIDTNNPEKIIVYTSIINEKGVQITKNAGSGGVSTKNTRLNPLCLSTHMQYKNTTTDSEIIAQLDLAKAAGVRWVRFDIFSAGITPTSGSTDFMKLDYLVDQALTRGIGVIALLSQYWSASWMQVYPGVWNSPPTPSGYATFASAMATHFKGRISLYELGNEPNLDSYWYPNADAVAYAGLVKAAYPAIKTSDPNAKVILGGIADSWQEQTVTNYITTLYTQGIGGNFDYFGFHPYSWPASPDDTNYVPRWSYMKTLRTLMTNYGDGTKPIAATEVGWPTHVAPQGQQQGVSETVQGQYISRVYQKITKEDYQDIALACIYDMINDGTDISQPEHNFGIYYYNRTPKPSFNSYKNERMLYDQAFAEIGP